MSERVFQILPDIGDDAGIEEIRPAKDGKSWLKACDECAFQDPMQRKAYSDGVRKSGNLFYCVHRETECGEHRVCAGFAKTPLGRSMSREECSQGATP